MEITIFVKTSSYSILPLLHCYSTSMVKERYLQLLHVTVGDRHSIVNKNDDGDMMMMLPAMKDSQVVHEEEEEVDSRSNDDMII